MMCYACAAEGYPYDSKTCKDCEFKPTDHMVSIGNVMKILSEYMICDGLYRSVEMTEIVCKLIQVSTEKKPFVEEEWCE